MKQISSRDNPLYKELKLLASSSQARRKMQRSLLEGVHLCDAYLQHVGKAICCIATETALADHEVMTVMRRCEETGTQCIVLPEALYGALSQVEHGVGLLFVVDTPQCPMPARLTRTSLLLDGLQDPGNLGSILRSAAAAGIVDIFCGKGSVSAWSPKVLRAGMGAHFLLRIRENVDLMALAEKADIPLLATSSHAAKCLYDLDLRGEVGWLFGHEGQGVSPTLLEQATHRVSIPHLGAVESLNVAASVAICVFEQVRQKKD